jgi:hypothetical protein
LRLAFSLLLRCCRCGRRHSFGRGNLMIGKSFSSPFSSVSDCIYSRLI